jgi:hypothetical protein
MSEIHKKYLPDVSSEGSEQQSGWCPGQWMMLVVPFLPPTEARHPHPAGSDATEVRPPDCPFESALAAAGSGTCQTGHKAATASVSAGLSDIYHNAATFPSQIHTQGLAVANLRWHNIPSVSSLQNSHLFPVSILMQILH